MSHLHTVLPPSDVAGSAPRSRGTWQCLPEGQHSRGPASRHPIWVLRGHPGLDQADGAPSVPLSAVGDRQPWAPRRMPGAGHVQVQPPLRQSLPCRASCDREGTRAVRGSLPGPLGAGACLRAQRVCRRPSLVPARSPASEGLWPPCNEDACRREPEGCSALSAGWSPRTACGDSVT